MVKKECWDCKKTTDLIPNYGFDDINGNSQINGYVCEQCKNFREYMKDSDIYRGIFDSLKWKEISKDEFEKIRNIVLIEEQKKLEDSWKQEEKHRKKSVALYMNKIKK